MFGPILPTREEELYLALCEIGKARGHEEVLVEALFALLPDGIKYRKALMDPVLGFWRYDFGKNFRDIPGLVGGSHLWPKLSLLYDALSVANSRLSPEEQAEWAKRLGVRSQHCIWREEMLAVLNVNPSVPVEYERPTVGEKSVDWYVEPQHGPNLLLEVKHRVVDTVDFLKEVASQINAGATQLNDDMELDMEPLFKSIATKLAPGDPREMLQGAWIRTGIKHPEIADYFRTEVDARIHFVVLPQSNDVLSRTPEQGAQVKRVLGLRIAEEHGRRDA